MGIFHDYNWEELSRIQVSKQADILQLFILMEDMFDQKVKIANWNYYEPKTIHDSSLSLFAHSILASDIFEGVKAYNFFRRASQIDFGPSPDSSNSGIHVGSMGGIWQSVVYGFGGLKIIKGKLNLKPKLPPQWTKLKFPLIWKQAEMRIEIEDTRIGIRFLKQPESKIKITINSKKYSLDTDLKISIR